ncbi:glycosyltransferase family 2 protein [Microbacterium sp.]|uniref:glycosyltransferase family 2 protein n=1 Tax=Microbacterium sp. TaxID=51671 RepID=UPI003A8BA5A0
MTTEDILPWFLLICFLIPLVEVIMMAVGALWATIGYRRAPRKFTELIIQVTTVGKEPELVQRTVDTIRGYKLKMPYQIWVAIEPGHFVDYENVDRVIVVPDDFECLPIDKARALEFTRRLREELGLSRPDVKIILVDDDTLPSRRYVNLAYTGDYDLCQGVTVPNRWYAIGGWRHFLLSHLDDIRTRNCLVYCSCTQGMLQKPLFVHGEGLCITGHAEKIVTWNRRIVASDDLVFGTNAAHRALSWGYFHAAIQLVSPWSFRENLNQRWRWTWGNFDAIASRDIMPRGAAIFKAAKYAMGLISVTASTTGLILLLTGQIKVPHQAHTVFLISLSLWFFSYGISGWINAGGQPNREQAANREAWGWFSRRVLWPLSGHSTARVASVRFWGSRVMQGLAATILTPMTALTPIFVIIYSVVRGRPKKFIMIKKANDVMRLSADNVHVEEAALGAVASRD